LYHELPEPIHSTGGEELNNYPNTQLKTFAKKELNVNFISLALP